MLRRPSLFFFFFFNDTATTEIYTLSLHDALPISFDKQNGVVRSSDLNRISVTAASQARINTWLSTDLSMIYTYANNRSEEHTSELQSLAYLVCRLLLEKKKNKKKINKQL